MWANCLVAAGDEVSILTSRRSFGSRAALQRPAHLAPTVTLNRLVSHWPAKLRGLQPSGAPLLLTGLRRALATTDVAVIFNAGWPLTLQLAGFGSHSWPPTAYRTYWHPPHGRLAPLNRIRSRFASRAFSKSDVLIAPTEQEAATLRRLTGDRVRIETVLPGVNRPGPQPSDARVELRSQFSIPREAVIALQLGRPGRFKGTHRAIKAIANLRSRGIEAYLLIAGKPVDQDWLQAVIARECAQRWALPLGEISDKRKLEVLGGADVLLMLSDYEAFGFVALEAIASGCGVVTYGDMPAAELLKEYRAEVVDRNESSVEDALLRVAASGKVAKQPPSWEESASELRRILLDLACQPQCTMATPKG